MTFAVQNFVVAGVAAVTLSACSSQPQVATAYLLTQVSSDKNGFEEIEKIVCNGTCTRDALTKDKATKPMGVNLSRISYSPEDQTHFEGLMAAAADFAQSASLTCTYSAAIKGDPAGRVALKLNFTGEATTALKRTFEVYIFSRASSLGAKSAPVVCQ